MHGGKGSGRPVTHGAYSKLLREKAPGLAPYLATVEDEQGGQDGVSLAPEIVALRARLLQVMCEEQGHQAEAALSASIAALLRAEKNLDHLVSASLVVSLVREVIDVVRTVPDAETSRAIMAELARRGVVPRAGRDG